MDCLSDFRDLLRDQRNQRGTMVMCETVAGIFIGLIAIFILLGIILAQPDRRTSKNQPSMWTHKKTIKK